MEKRVTRQELEELQMAAAKARAKRDLSAMAVAAFEERLSEARELLSKHGEEYRTAEAAAEKARATLMQATSTAQVQPT